MNNEICELNLDELNSVSGGGECSGEPIHFLFWDITIDRCAKTVEITRIPTPKQN